MKIFLIADIYENSNLDSFYIQEWESAASVHVLKTTLEEMGHEVLIREPISEKARLVFELSQIKDSEKSNTLLWNLVEGFFSRNREAYIPALAEFMGFPYTGSDTYSQSLSLDKALTKKIAQDLNIPTCRFQVWRDPHIKPELLDFPFFIKPNGEGSSLGIGKENIIKSQNDWEVYCEKQNKKIFPLLLEKYLPGKEYTVGILGSKDHLKPTRVAEITYPSIVYGSEIKTKAEMPEKLEPLEDTKKESFIQKASLQLAKEIGISGYSRLDWKEDKDGKPQFLEINLTPGLSVFYSSLPICAKFSGITYHELLQGIIQSACRDYLLPDREYGRR